MAFKLDLVKIKEHGVVNEIKQDVIHVTGLTNCMNGQLDEPYWTNLPTSKVPPPIMLLCATTM